MRAYPGDPVLGALRTIGENFLLGANNARGITGLTAVLKSIGDDGGKRFDGATSLALRHWTPTLSVCRSVAANTAALRCDWIVG